MRTRLISVLVIAMGGGAFADTHYVDVHNPFPSAPYTDWGSAATNIQAAVDEATDGDLVLVTNGVYEAGGRAMYGTMTNRVAIDKAVTVRSVGGPNLTWIVGQGAGESGTNNGDGAIRCVYAGTNALLEGFTLTNGHTRHTGDWDREQSGGGAWGASGGVLTNCILVGNSANYQGGGVFSGSLYNCTVINNSALLGGGTYSSTLYQCNVSSNWASQEAGGACRGDLYGCFVTGNSAILAGGGAASANLFNCVLMDNWAGETGGGTYYGSGANCTVIRNTASMGGGSYYSFFKNSILYYNTASASPNAYFPRDFRFCCTTPLPSGESNISVEPQLATPTHLSAASPCIAAGSTNYTTGVDIDGEPWQNPPCIGADQYTTGNLIGPVSIAIEMPYTNVAVAFALSCEAHIQGRVSASAWNFGDGTAVSNTPFIKHAWALPGSYVVRLTAYNDTYPDGVSTTALVHVVSQPVHYVNAFSLLPEYPYSTWETAATSIQPAVDAALPGSLVLVSNGVYAAGGQSVYGTATNRVVLANGVQLRSVNGPDVTIVSGALATRCAYVGAGATLSGFTLTNGQTVSGIYANKYLEMCGGGVWCDAEGVLTNCILTGNSASWYGGGTFCGTLYNCMLKGNSGNNGGGAIYANLYNCIFLTNLAGHGGGARESSVYYSTLIGNSASYGGGGASGCDLYNCMVSGNSASQYGGGTANCTSSNCVISGNSAGSAGGDYGGKMYNCTVVLNQGTTDSGGTYQSSLCNSILYYNTAPSAPNHSGSKSTNSCTTPLPSGMGNITNEPGFVDFPLRNFRLLSNSPCINAGRNSYAAVDMDADGNPRISGGTVDLGAYEFQNPASLMSYAWLLDYGLSAYEGVDAEDTDRDGLSNWQEWISDSNPTNALSYFQIMGISNGSPVTIWFQSSSNRYYSLFYTGLTNNVWQNGTQRRRGNGGLQSLTDRPTSPRFYRMSVERP